MLIFRRSWRLRSRQTATETAGRRRDPTGPLIATLAPIAELHQRQRRNIAFSTNKKTARVFPRGFLFSWFSGSIGRQSPRVQ